MLVASVSTLVLGLTLHGGPALAQTAWNGSTSTDWFTPGNWSAGVPVAGATTTINTTTPNTAIITQAGAVSGAMQIGVNGNDGGLTIVGNGTLQSGSANIGSGAGAASAVTLTGANATWTLTGTPFVGLDNGSGTLLITNGATVTSSGGQIGATAGATGAVVVGGATWSVANTLNVGNAAQGILSITGGGRVESNVGTIGTLSTSNGSATVASGATWETGELNVGFAGVGSLDVESGGVVTASNTETVTIGRVAGSQGTVTVSGANSQLNGGQFVILGRLGAGTLLVEDGGTVSSGNVIFANEAGATGTVTVTGANSSWQSNGIRIGGNAGASIATRSGAIDVLDGGEITTGELVVGAGAFSTGEVTVSGTGSSLSSTTLIVGQEGVGTLLIEAGGEVFATGRTDVGLQRGSRGTSTTTVTGGGSLLSVGGTIFVGGGTESVGVLQARDGGVIRATSIGLGNGIDGSGTLVIGAASGDAAAAPGTIDVGTLDFGFGTGSLVFNHTAPAGSALSFDAEVRSGNANSTIRHLAGVTDFSGDGSAFNGTTSVLGGTLNVTGALGSTVSVLSGGTLGGSGTLETVTVADGGILAPGTSPGTITMGSLVLNAGSTLDFELGTPGVVGGGVNDLIVVTGGLTLDGTLDVTALPDFGNGLYTLIEYGNLVADNGLDIGTTPGGFSYALDSGTGADSAVTLEVSGGAAGGNQFWDGFDTTADGTVDGGSGFWDATRTNWTNQSGTTNAAWGSEFAIFGGASGQVTVVGPQTFTGLQFLTDGYRIGTGSEDAALVTNTAETNVRVGTGITARIQAPITGSGGLVKQEGGTLVLTRDNDLGSAVVRGGAVHIEAGGSLDTSGTVIVGDQGGSDGMLAVTGAGSSVRSGALLTIGEFGRGTLEVAGGGAVLAVSDMSIGDETGGEGLVTVSGAGSTLDIGGQLDVGDDGAGTLSVAAGGVVDVSGLVVVGEEGGSEGLVTVDGAGSTFGTGVLLVGLAGQGDLVVANGGLVDAIRIDLGVGATGQGRLIVGGEGATQAAGAVDTSRIDFGSGAGTLVFNHTASASTPLVFGTTLRSAASGTHAIRHLAGVTNYSGNGTPFTGTTTVEGGTLNVTGTLGGTMSVQSGSVLGGSGTLGAVTVADGGILAPGTSPGTITMGSLTLNGGSILDFELGTPGLIGGGVNDLIVVTGGLTLDGTLNVTALPDFGNGLYTLIEYGNLVADNGLDIGTTPDGFTYALNSGTGTNSAVTLNVSSAAAGGNQFWDGTGPFGDGTVDGGTGVWSAGLTNWTDQDGNDVEAWGNGFAIFGGAAGTVSVVGSQTFSGMQFLTDGYTIAAGAGGGLVTNTAQTNIRVGNGIAATIATPISGSGGLVKQEGGTLTITADGSSRWRVAGGELVVEGDMTSPAPTGAGTQTPLFALESGTTLTIGGAGSITVDPAYAGLAIEGLGGGTTVNIDGAVTAGGAEAILFRTPGAPSTVGDDVAAAVSVVTVEKAKLADLALNIFNGYLADPAAFDSSPRTVPPANTGSIFASGDLNEVNVGLTGQVTGTIAGSAGTSTRLDIDGGLLMTSADGTAAFILLPSTVATPGAAEIWLRNDGRIETTGASSAGVVLSPQTGSLVRIDGGSSIATSGNNSAGIAIDADSMVSHFESSGGGPTPIIETSGDNSPGFIASGAGSSVISFQVFGPDARFVTRGNDSDLFAVDMVEISSTSVLMQRASLLTQGDGSNAFSINGGDRPVAGDGSDLTLILQDVDTRTEGDNATALSIAERGSNSSTVFQFTRNNIETLGDGSSGLVYESENFLSSLMNLIAVDTTVSTQGADADGARIELGRFENSVGTYIFDDLSVTTAGDRSRGLVASFGSSPGSTIDFRMTDVGVTTSGAEAHGIVLEGLGRPDGTTRSELNMSNVSATTSGAGAHALVIGANTRLTDDATRFAPSASGGIGSLIDSFDGFVATGEGGRAIYNLGLIDGGADGIVLGAGVRGNIANGGTITAQGPDAVTFGSTDDLFELLTTGVVTGDVRAGDGTDTFILGGTGAASFDVSLLDGDNTDDGEQYLGFETFEKRGASTWTLTGSNTEVDNFAVLGGTALVNGTLSSAAVSVGSGSTLGGIGTIGSLIAMNGAIVAPGPSIGTLTVNGDATFQAGSTYAVEIDAAGNADLLAVGGVAFLGGTLAVDGLGYPVGYATDQDYTIITATGGVQGTFDQVTDNLPDVDVMATYNANDVVIGYRGATSPADMSAKELYPNALQGSLRAAALFGDLMGERARIGSTQASGLSGSVLTGYGPADRGLAGGATSAYGVSTWAGVAGRTTDVDAAGGVPGYDGDFWGIASGVDATFALGDGIGRAGLALGYTSADIGVGPAAADAQAWHAGLYAAWEAGPLGLSGAFGYGWQDNDFSRAIALGGGGLATATGSASGESAVVSGRASWDLARQMGVRPDIGFRFAPTASFEHLWARRGGFTETGAGVLNLTVGPDSVAQTWLGIGVETSARFEMANGVALTPSLAVMYEHNVGDRRAITSSAIPAATAAFTTSGVLEDAGIVSVGAGLGVEFNERATLKFGYSGAFGSNTTSHQGQVSFSLKF